jgi:hypothetical protein
MNLFDPSLTFNWHISVLTHNFFSCLGFVLWNSRDFENPAVLKHLYIILICSSLESSSCVWNPHKSKYMLMLEKVQKAFLHCYYKRNDSYYPYMYPTKFLLGMLGLNSLEAIRDRIELSTAVEILCGGIESPEYLEQLSRLYVPDNYLHIQSMTHCSAWCIRHNGVCAQHRYVGCTRHLTHSLSLIQILLFL